MAIIVYHENYDLQESLDNFLNLHFSSQMKYFASDLLEKGLSPTEVSRAIRRAMVAAESGGLELRKHFQLTYTERGGVLLKDCKLSDLGYAMVLLNAPAENPIAGKWQLKVLSKML